MVFYAAFNSISVISRRQLTLFMSLSWVSPVLDLGSEVSCPRTTKKTSEDPVQFEPRIEVNKININLMKEIQML